MSYLCSTCKSELGKKAFSTAQLKKTDDVRVCKTCRELAWVIDYTDCETFLDLVVQFLACPCMRVEHLPICGFRMIATQMLHARQLVGVVYCEEISTPPLPMEAYRVGPNKVDTRTYAVGRDVAATQRGACYNGSLCQDSQVHLVSDVMDSKLSLLAFIDAYELTHANACLESIADDPVGAVYVVPNKRIEEGEEITLSFGLIYWLRQFTLQDINAEVRRHALELWERLD